MKSKITERVQQPTPVQVKEAREKAGHSQTQAGEMVSAAENARQTWVGYERELGTGKRNISLSTWELYLLLTDQHPTMRVVSRE